MEVHRRAGIGRKEFVDCYVRPNRPVIFTDITHDWQARRVFSFHFFRHNFADLSLDVRGRSFRLGELLDRLEAGDAGPELYPCKLDLRRPELSELARMVEPRPAVLKPDRTNSPLLPRRFLQGLYDLEIFFGGKGGEFPYLHYDYLGLYAFINQLQGRKEFTLFSPDQQAYLYPCKDRPWLSRIEDHHRPDLERFPLFRRARPITVVLEAGETLFIPRKWYHTARSLEPTISVAMDQLCHFNWGQFVEECLISRHKHPLKRQLAAAYLHGLGQLFRLRDSLARNF